MKSNLKKIIPVIASIAIFSSAFIFIILHNSENPEGKLQLSPRIHLFNEKYGEVQKYDGKDISSHSFVKNVRLNEYAGASEPKIICNPKNNNILAVSANDFSLRNNSARIFISEDKGLNWEPKEIPLSHEFKKSFYSDPWIEYDTEGNLFFVTVQRNQLNNNEEALYFAKSNDNGTTWEREHFVDYNSKESIYLDRPKMFIDKSVSQKNSIYVVWIEMKALKSFIMFSKSTDGGNTFSTPSSIERDDAGYCSVICNLTGDLFIAYLKDENKICIKKSTNTGDSWFKEQGCIDINPSGIKYENQYLIKKNVNEGIRINSEPNLAVTGENDLLLAYSAKYKNTDAADIFFAKIRNNSDSVSVPVKVNTDGTLNDQYLPAITSDEFNNILITYQDSRNDAGNILTETYISVSTDGGISFSDEKLSTSGFNPSSVAVGKYFGDYNSCIISEGNLIAVWTDGRNNNFDVYAGILRVSDIIGNRSYKKF